jgi:hypothetical protein
MDILVLSLVAGMVVAGGLWLATRPTASHENGPEDRGDDGLPAYEMDDGPLGQENAARVPSAADEISSTGE